MHATSFDWIDLTFKALFAEFEQEIYLDKVFEH